MRNDAVAAVERKSEADALASKSSLSVYADLGHRADLGPAKYLHDTYNREGVRLMTKARLGHLLLMKNVATIRKWRPGAGMCLACRTGIEDVDHFVMRCPALEPCRRNLHRRLQEALRGAGIPGRMALLQFQSGGAVRLRLLLGAGMAFQPAQGFGPRQLPLQLW